MNKRGARFWAKAEKTESCWEWRGTRDRAGYGRFSDGRRFGTNIAHRISYLLTHGSIPAGLDLDHLCRNRGCVNPDHLEPVTHHENCLRGAQAQQTHCINGHPFNEENTRIRVHRDGSPYRQCYPCVLERSRRSRQRTA